MKWFLFASVGAIWMVIARQGRSSWQGVPHGDELVAVGVVGALAGLALLAAFKVVAAIGRRLGGAARSAPYVAGQITTAAEKAARDAATAFKAGRDR